MIARPKETAPERGYCARKTRYDSEKLANRVAENAFKKRGIILRSYVCPTCRGWHLTTWGWAGDAPASGEPSA